jgi:hypothetical protein
MSNPNQLQTTNTISGIKVHGAVTSALSSATKARNNIHVALCASVQYAWENKGAGLDKYMQRLFQGLFDADVKANHEQMKAWTENNFPIKVLFDKEKQQYKVKLSKKWDNLTDDDWQFDTAREVPYFKLDSKSAADAKPIGFDILLLALKRVATIEQQDKRPIVEKDKALIHDLSQKVQGLLDSYGASK